MKTSETETGLAKMFHRRGKYKPLNQIVGHHSAGAATFFQDVKNESVEQRAVGLRRLLQDSGPLFSSFALYLSSRIDLLPAEFCRELARTADASQVLSALDVEKIVVAELGSTFHRMFSKFEPVPFRTSLMDQTHAAVLANGDGVTVCLLRPEYAELGTADQIVSLIRKKPLRVFCPDLAEEAVITDFASTLQRATNLPFRGQAMEGHSIAPSFLETMPVCKVYRELSGKRTLTVAGIGRATLDQAMRCSQYDLPVLARRICQAWLREALYGRYVPVDPRPGNIIVAEPVDVTFAGNEFIELPPRTTENLRHYLLATLVDDPDRATLHLLQEMHPPRGGLKEAAEFRSRFRQAAYFGALEPVLGTDTNALAQLIFQHWKTALTFGYRPTPHLLGFYRGLFSVARTARELAPAEDPLRDGLEELDADVMFEQLNDILGTNYWSQSADKFVAALVSLPQTIDDALNRGVSDGQGSQIEPALGRIVNSRRKSIAALALFIAAITFILQAGIHHWMEQGVVLALMIVGLVCLRTWGD
jgi:predicted unusual protein kinase regulating ubiquinone biosynthesis (AarF/ABC1/UbiB family)